MRLGRLSALSVVLVVLGNGVANASVAARAHGAAVPLTPIPIQADRRRTVCTMEYRPVCAWRRGRSKTYSNACHAERSGARVIHRGECRGRYR